MKGKFFLCLTVSIFLITNLFGASKKADKEQVETDLSLFEIDRLIRKTEYDEALRQLNTYLENNPERFDNAQTRIRRIMNARMQYSILAEKLIDLIQTDPSNSKEIYEITARLEQFEKHPSDKNLQFIADLKKSAEFNYFRALFLQIQNESADNSSRGNYVAAIEKVKEGFWLYRDNFYERWEENPEITTPVNAILADIDLQIGAYEEKNYINKITETVNAFNKAVSQGQYNVALERFNDVNNSFRDLSRIRNKIYSDAGELQKIFLQVQELDEDTSDASFLPFIIRFIYGAENIENSGIIGAFDLQWRNYVQSMNDTVYEAVKGQYNKFSVAINDGYVTSVRNYSTLEKRVLNLYDYLTHREAEAFTHPFEHYYIYDDYIENLSSQSLKLTKVSAEVEKETVAQKKYLSEKSEQSIKQLFDSSARVGELVGIKSEQEIKSFEWSKDYIAGYYSEFSELEEYYSNLLDQVFESSSSMLNAAWKEITDYYVAQSDMLVNRIEYQNIAAEKLIKGVNEKISAAQMQLINSDVSRTVEVSQSLSAAGENDYLSYSYPSISLKLCEYTQKQVEDGVRTINGYESIINANFAAHPQWQTDEGISGIVSFTNEYLENQKGKLSQLSNAALAFNRSARRQVEAFELAKNEGDARYSEAENALRQENFDMARRKLQEALAKYDDALNQQTDDAFRQQVDNRLQTLGDRITKLENEIVVREVRQLKTDAKDAYFNGRFDDAEKLLNQAKIRWAVTNTIEDEEITNLLNFVNTAISMNTGREIIPTAPQYPEMSQLLNIASQYYDEGEKLIAAGKTSEADEVLDKAVDSIQKVQYVYPLNQKASILTLKINRLRDTKKFNEEFSQKIQTARTMCKNPSTRQEGYANLLDYYELDPSYKGLKDLLYQTEIDIGIRQKPVDNSAATRAKRLLTDAEKLYNNAGNDQVKLRSALEKIEQSLTLNPNNNSAMVLKDRITTKIGGNAVTVLTMEDERLYQQAIQRLQNNNVPGANAIVLQLLKKPGYANIQKIKDLQNKIEARS